MSVDPTSSTASDSEVMSSVATTESGPALVIADVTRDGAWVSVRERDAPILEEWC